MFTLLRVVVVGSWVAALAVSAAAQGGSSKAAQAFKDANRLYQQQDYSRAAGKYEEVVQIDPSLSAAHFYLANSYDNLYRPARKGEPQNDEYLRRAIENYRKSLGVEQDPQLKKLSLEYLVVAYGPDKMDDQGQAVPIVEDRIRLDPTEPSNYVLLAKMWEYAGDYEMAEEQMLKAKELRPIDSNACTQLAGFYERWGEFEKTMQVLQEWADTDPMNAVPYYTISSYYWEKAYRDYRMREADKLNYIDLGIRAADRAIELKADYSEALTYKNLLLRSKALLTRDPDQQQALIEEANRLRDRAMELRKKKSGLSAVRRLPSNRSLAISTVSRPGQGFGSPGNIGFFTRCQ